MDKLAYSHVEFNYLETLAKTFIIPARQNQFIQENLLNNAPVRRIAITMKTNLQSLDLILKILSGFNNLMSDKLEYSEEVSQS